MSTLFVYLIFIELVDLTNSLLVVTPLWHIIPQPTSLCSYSFMLPSLRRSSIYQFHCGLFHKTSNWTHDLQHTGLHANHYMNEEVYVVINIFIFCRKMLMKCDSMNYYLIENNWILQSDWWNLENKCQNRKGYRLGLFVYNSWSKSIFCNPKQWLYWSSLVSLYKINSNCTLHISKSSKASHEYGVDIVVTEQLQVIFSGNTLKIGWLYIFKMVYLVLFL